MQNKPRLNPTAAWRTIPIFRPQYPQVLKWIDPEFEVVYINLDASPDANVVWMLEDDADDDLEADNE